MPQIKIDIRIEEDIVNIQLDSIKKLPRILPVFMKTKEDKQKSKILAKNLIKTFNKINKMLE